MDNGQLTPERAAMLQMLIGGGYASPAAPLEFSVSAGGYMPPDIGSMGAYTNQVQDWVALAPLLNAVSGLGGPTEAAPSGRMMLEAVLASTPPTSWENVLAQFLISGESPSTAIEKTLNTFADDPELQQFIPGDGEQWRKEVASQAQTWFSGLMEDQVAQQSGAGRSEIDSALGLPDAGTAWSLNELNPALAGASEQYSTSRDEAMKLLGRDRRAAASEVMGDEDAYRRMAMDAYLNPAPAAAPAPSAASPAASRQASTKTSGSGPRPADELIDGVTYMAPDGKLYYYDSPLTNEQMTTATLGLGYNAQDPVNQEAAERIRLATPAMSSGQDASSGQSRRRRAMQDVMQSEISRDLAKARNNAYSKDYKVQADTAGANDQALRDRDAARKEALWAVALNQVLSQRGITPRSVAANRFLSAGQALFGG